ncbi:helix-turn-helix domain-containing protein [Noviherbaspirillum sp.]|jgi:transcriptional regulator GlxA family with amidase domain|uniref:GlxA family transcriptional regulator n=1 Tax=Noviherbaspirillum sp. TaxID=1926288 RepID=UPI0025E47737|nr:helix-turn-helix domain-containing protein [Noviherbaspirillum sp.]
MKTVLILALDGVMDSSLAITLDTIRAGQSFLSGTGKRSQVRILVAGHRKSVRTGAGLQLKADLSFRDALKEAIRPDWIVIPGLGMVSDDAISTRLAQKDVDAAVELLRQASRSTRIGASCSSVFLLARTGLLAGREVTTTWWLAHLFRARHPDVRLDETRMLVRDGPFLTAGSAYSQLDLMLAIVADIMGTAIAHLCSRYLLIDQRPSQARYMVHAHVQHIDPTVIAAERWIDAHLAEPISIAALAAELSVSAKTLARRVEAATGVSPVKFVQRRRLLHASHLIETTSMSIEAIAAKVGYQDGTALRKLVRREFGTTPAALRS